MTARPAGPAGALSSQLFFYQAHEGGDYSRDRTGLQHIAFFVQTRDIVDEAPRWAVARAAPRSSTARASSEYGVYCAVYWIDPHGFKLEAVCPLPP